MDVKWIKLSTALFSNRKIRQIEAMKDGDAILVIWIKILILAGELNESGAVFFTKDTPFTEEQLAVQFGRPREIIALALRTFEAFDMVEYVDGIMYVRNWEKYQNTAELEHIRELNKERQQRFRDRKKDSNVTHNDAVTLHNGTDKNRKDKNRLDKTLTQSMLKKWQTNLDAEEANEEIRT